MPPVLDFEKILGAKIVSLFQYRDTFLQMSNVTQINLEFFLKGFRGEAKSCHVLPKTCHDFAQYWT
jgi:hypothetical protein